MISIIIPIYNQAGKLSSCLESIKKQTYDNFEIILVNDGSTDDIHSVAEIWKQEFGIRFEYISYGENKGAPAARNAGLAKSKGAFILFCDADATLEPFALETMLEALGKHTEASYAYSSFLWGRKLFKSFPFDAERLKKEPYIHTISLIRREHMPKSGWDESIKKFQDWDLWLTMLKEDHNGYWIDQVLFRVSPGGSMSNWVPKIFYKLFPFLLEVKKYKAAMGKVKEKHGL
ncbi:hypothetical protein COV49_01945 [Candidatus Falkowbacteria bacterium CG11_big_fil_rev_8_21_14_0_20_39_10]|uniref:Glycosyltransferase 2-like domain-containing protein n=1 Tax=Candidatus Falkowbacteria bacterium CG11_big_fil_rev_8_21_14_0_20_39_10 TaxID=1974570 RepID=A0A2M6K963_9BACT|nr:MAG: hypothetical protein COV49_01945 [Candidatus Falkowbacteria bacterium CG11_big_fil_rev_8_21_14_0_20_39_10]